MSRRLSSSNKSGEWLLDVEPDNGRDILDDAECPFTVMWRRFRLTTANLCHEPAVEGENVGCLPHVPMHSMPNWVPGDVVKAVKLLPKLSARCAASPRPNALLNSAPVRTRCWYNALRLSITVSNIGLGDEVLGHHEDAHFCSLLNR